VGHEDQKKLAKRPKIPQGKAKPAAQGEPPKTETPPQPGGRHNSHHGQAVVDTMVAATV